MDLVSLKVGKHRDETCCPWSSGQTESLMPLGDFNLSLIALAISFSIQRELGSCAIKFILRETLSFVALESENEITSYFESSTFPLTEIFPFRENFVLDISLFCDHSCSFLCTSSRIRSRRIIHFPCRRIFIFCLYTQRAASIPLVEPLWHVTKSDLILVARINSCFKVSRNR